MPDIEAKCHDLIKSTHSTHTHIIKNKRRFNNHPTLQRRALRLREFTSLVHVAQPVCGRAWFQTQAF